MKTKLLFGLLVSVFLLQATTLLATTINFGISGTYSQGGVADLPATDVSLGAAGYFTLDPGASGNYFDFKLPGSGTFSTTDNQLSNYYFLKSYNYGEIIGAGNFGNHISIPGYSGYDWDTILVGGQTAGVWGGAHTGYLGFMTDDSLFGWIGYDFSRNGATSTITFLDGAYNDVAGDSILAGGGAPVPEPSTIILLGCGLAGLAWRGMKRKSA